MFKRLIRGFTVYFSVLLVSTTLLASVQAADAPLELSARFSLTGPGVRNGQTFFELMSKKGGIKDKLDQDYESSFEIADVDTLMEALDNFDHVDRKIAPKIKGGKKGLKKLFEELAGTEAQVKGMYALVARTLKEQGLLADPSSSFNSLTIGGLVPLIAIGSGKGVLVQLDQENYCYNYGYAKGAGKPRGPNDTETREQNDLDRKTGRSFGASVERNAYDPSDKDYLKDLSKYFNKSSDKELSRFYRTLFEILLKVDTSGLQKLSADGQLLLTDFIAVYMAELTRHLMTGLTAYEWENALTEITLLAAYSASDDGKTLYGEAADNESGRELVDSSSLDVEDRMVGFFGIGTQGTGLDGRNKKRRHNLTQQIVKAQSKLNPDLVSEISDLVGVKKGADIYDETMEFVNNYRTQDTVRQNADELIDAWVRFAMDTRKNAAKISKMIR